MTICSIAFVSGNARSRSLLTGVVDMVTTGSLSQRTSVGGHGICFVMRLIALDKILIQAKS